MRKRLPKLVNDYETLVEPHLKGITDWREQGYSLYQIADFLGVSRFAMARYMRAHPALLQAWDEGQVGATLQLEDAAIRESIGYFYTETQEQLLYDKDGNLYGRKVIKSKKYRPPQATILLEALKVHHPQKWAMIQTVDKDIQIVLPEELEEFSK